MDPSPLLNHLLIRDAAATAVAATSSPTTPAEQFLSLVSDPFKTQLQTQAFTSALSISVAITVLVAIIFSLLRPYNATVYAPRLKHADEKHAPEPLGKSPWAWVSPVVLTKEQLLVEKIGMDATIFIRFTAMLRDIFLVLTVVGCGILIPLYLVGGKQNYGTLSAFTKLTPQFLIGLSFWGIVAAAWAINIVVIGFLWWNYRAVTNLRRHYFQSPDYLSSLHSRTIMVTEIPKQLATDEGVIRVLDQIKQSAAMPKATIGRNVKGLPDLIEEHDELVKKLESVLAKYLKHPDKLPAKRPVCKVSKKDKTHTAGESVDAIKYLTQRIEDLESEIKKIRSSIDTRDSMPYGFASYESVEEAHSVAYACRAKHPQGTNITLAPRPAEIIWKNLSLSQKSRKGRQFMINVWIMVLTIIWIAPNVLLAVFISNLSNLGLVWPAFNDSLMAHPKIWAVVQGVAAPLINSLIYLVLPKIFRRLAESAGDLSKTERDRHVLSSLYAFFVFNSLICFSLYGSVWGLVAAIINAKDQDQNILDAIKGGQMTQKLMIALCNVAPYWVSR
jgi:hypothetical protein